MLKCPYCYEELDDKPLRCPHCDQYIIDEVINAEFASIDKKHCIFCGKNVLSAARVCKHCHKWLDEVDRAVNDLDLDDLYE